MALRFLDSSRNIVDIVGSSSKIDSLVLVTGIIGIEKRLTGKHTNILSRDKGDGSAACHGKEHSDDHESGDTGSSREVVLYISLIPEARAKNLP